MSDTMVQIWNKDWTLAHAVHAAELLEVERGRLTFPGDHPVAQWLVASDRPGLYVTIDRDGERWVGGLSGWTTSRPGKCPECDHCNRAQLETTWREDWVPPPASTVVWPNPFLDTN